MQNLLVVGVLAPQTISNLTVAVDKLVGARLTVYAPADQQSAWPTEVTFISGDLTDVAGLTAAALDQDLVLVQLDAAKLVAETQAITTALRHRDGTQLVIASPDSLLSLTERTVRWYQHRSQRRQIAALKLVEAQLRQSGVTFALIEGQTARDTVIYTTAMTTTWASPVPTRRPLQLTDYLAVPVEGSLVA